MHGRPAAFTRALRSTSTMTRVDRYFSRRSILFATLLLPILATTVTADLTRYETCYLRCIAGCVQNGTSLIPCRSLCEPYEKVNFCDPEDAACWSVCRDLGEARQLQQPTNVHTDYSNGTRTVEWQDVPGASLYAAQYRTAGGQFEEDKSMLSTTSSLSNVQLPGGRFCDPFAVRIAAFAQTGVSNFSADTNVESPKPSVSPQLKLVSIKYEKEHFISDFYRANGTLIVTFEFDDQHWPLGVDDLTVLPMFNLINCQIADFAQTVPMPEFVSTNVPRQLSARLGADQMYRRCRYVYYTQSATSNQCKTETNYYSPPVNALRTLDINCTTVQNSPCLASAAPAPICGQINSYNVTPITPEDSIRADLNRPISVNLTFDPLTRSNEVPTLYFVAMYGNAVPFEAADQQAYFGVNQTDVMGTTTTCPGGRMSCNKGTDDTSFIIDNLSLDSLYGVTICAIKSHENVLLPAIPSEIKASKPRSLSVKIEKIPYLTDSAPLIVGLSVGGGVGLILAVVCIACCRMRMLTKKNRKYAETLKYMEKKNAANQYHEMPKRVDIWEIDRRNVDVYTNKKLGSGAFGAVYLGKLIGKTLASHDATSPLGVNLMRAENCEVAIKTLPESADEESKREFLREISLMKSIGYHERLVNMLACVTESEPCLLVVEYCSEGDLLEFLRKRCKYMMKLDEQGVNYTAPVEENDIDFTMIVTMKQLYMFAVQISYGLEYLSQKGFVHRDVAARNVLVGEGSSCKIGDFGLCRQIGKDEECYKSRGGRLPLKWMSPEAIRDYEFSTKSDVWAFGVLMFEIITLGGCPYPEWRAAEVLPNLEKGERMPQPDNCPDEIYSLMNSCWNMDTTRRPDFSLIRQRMATLLEDVTEEYSYLKLDAAQNYYNVQYEDDGRIDVSEMPARLPRRPQQQQPRPRPDAAAAVAAAPDAGMANPAFTVEIESEA
ncbi:hir-1 [Pristionchus pacificus]|uniref:Protein kinase domain-containing protein n=1 Tax=Pristionchus pacificus TaxID=54126 RepID=A0A2A6C589_PRIPA|nr:hir-1 [Pristionchus pacificus]|eukprot:PDM73276.1 protein kinase [Pristionchus pacificus]